MFGFLRRKALASPAPWAGATIELRERFRSVYSRNAKATTLAPLIRGYQFNCAHLVARAGSQIPLRLYQTQDITVRMKGKTYRRAGLSPVTKATQRRMASGVMGRKAATHAGLGREVAEVRSHPALSLLLKPNPMQNGESLDYQTLMMLQAFGDAFWALIRGDSTSPVGMLVPMLPPYTTIVGGVNDGANIVAGYNYGRNRAEAQQFAPEDVAHLKYAEHPTDPLYGMGPLEACYQAARVVTESEDYDLEFVDRGNIPPLFLSLDPKFYSGDARIQDFEKRLTEKTAGLSGKVRAMVGVGFNLLTPGANAKDLQTIEKIREHKATIRNAFGVPEALLELNSANLASATVGDDQFWGLTVRPLLNQVADFWTERLLPEFGVEPGAMFFAYDDPVLQDQEKESRIDSVDLASGVKSIDEVRQARGLEPLGGEAAKHRINGVPLELSGQPAPAASPFVFSGDLGRHLTREPIEKASPSMLLTDEAAELLGIRDADPAPVLISATRKSVELAPVHAGGDPYDDPCPACGGITKAATDAREVPIEVSPRFVSEAQAAAETRALVEAVDALEGDLEEAITEAKTLAVSQASKGQPIDLSGLRASLATKVAPAIRRMYETGFRLAADDLEEKVGASMTPEEFEAFVAEASTPNREAFEAGFDSLVRQFSADLTDSVATAIEGRVRESVEKGTSIAELMDELSSDQGFDRTRAERIARTETSRALNEGKRQRFKAAGVETVFWVNAPGASSVHKAIAAKYPKGNPIDEPFLEAGETVVGADGTRETYNRDVYAPPARPNCRCTIQTRKSDAQRAADESEGGPE